MNARLANKNHDKTYRMYIGDEDMDKVGHIMAIVLFVIAGLFFIMTRSFLSITLLIFALLSWIFMIIQIKFDGSEKKETDHYLTFLLFNEWRIWFGLFASCFLLGVIGNFLFPLYIAASDKQYWDDSYWGNMYYEVYFGFFITFLILFIAAIPSLVTNNLYLFHLYEGSVGENLDRTISSFTIIELLCTLGFAFVLKFEGIWLSGYFPILLYVLIAISIIFMLPFLYYGICRDKHLSLTTTNVVMWILLFFFIVFHCVMAIILFSNINVTYARTPRIFSYGFDLGYLKKILGEEKFYFVGDAQAITQCPKSLTVFNWEDPINQFGCLSMKAFYKGRSALVLLLDLLLALPVFEAVALYCYDDIDNAMPEDDQIKSDPLYAKCQEKFRLIISWFISIGLVLATIAVLCLNPFTNSAKFIYDNIDGIELNQEALKNYIIPSNQINYLSLGINEDLPEYFANGTIVDSEQQISIKIDYQPIDKSTPAESIDTKCNTLFTLGKLYPSPNNNPIIYSFTIKNAETSEEYSKGTFIVGGLLSGRYIDLGNIPLNKNANKKGIIKGFAYDLNMFTGIKEGKIFIVKDLYYPSTTDELWSNQTDFNPSNVFKESPIFISGFFIAFDVPIGEYTLIVYAKGYYIETLRFSITKENEQVDFSEVYLTKINPEIKFEVRLEWSTNVDLNLYSSFLTKDKKSCLIGYLNTECGEGIYSASDSEANQNYKYESIAFKKIGSFDYSFYVHNYQRRSGSFVSTHFTPGFISEEPEEKTEKMELEKTKAKVKVFLSEYRFAFLNNNVPFGTEGKRWNVFNMKVDNNALAFTIKDIVDLP